MGSVYNRGSRDKPLWYGQYKDLDGKLKKVPTGQPSKGAALLFVAEREREVAERLRARAAGLPDPTTTAPMSVMAAPAPAIAPATVPAPTFAPVAPPAPIAVPPPAGLPTARMGASRRIVVPPAYVAAPAVAPPVAAPPSPAPPRPKTFGDLVGKWKKGLVNRSAVDDRLRTERHLEPKWKDVPIQDIDLAAVLAWIEEQREAGKSDPLMRHNINLLSRFFSWAITRGHAAVNPVRQIPVGQRPRQTARSDTPWIADDAVVLRAIADLPQPFDLMFYLGNRSGLRTGEIAGLRLSDLGFLADGIIRVRYSYDGCLKEDKHQEGKVKWVPAPEDGEARLGEWLAKRRAEGAGPEDLVFVAVEGGCMNRVVIGRRWREVAKKHGLKMNFYQATRHSFTSRSLSDGASLDEVSAALGHSSPIVTRRYYDHFVRKSFSPTLRRGLKAPEETARAETPSKPDKE